MHFEKWTTILTDLHDLYFENLTDLGTDSLLVLKDKEENTYEVLFKNHGPYLVSDEEHRTDYWSHKEFKGDRTFRLRESTLLKEFEHNEALDPSTGEWRHLVVTSWDNVVEVLCKEEPEIRKI